MSTTADLDAIENSLQLLPEWSASDQRLNAGTLEQPMYLYFDPARWWERFAELSGYSRKYLYEKLAGMILELRSGDPRKISDAAAYLLMFFDNPAAYEHLDAVADHWETKVAGRIGQRWAETVCAAAWRLLVANEPSQRPDSHFTGVPWVNPHAS